MMNTISEVNILEVMSFCNLLTVALFSLLLNATEHLLLPLK